jgi:hypothetical protein
MMKLKLLVPVAVLLLLRCAPYKQLKPKPELVPSELGYMELKDDKKDFELKEGKKYFIAFPGPKEDNFYLVLKIANKDKINSFLTAKLEKKKIHGKEIEDESFDKARMSVYPIDKSKTVYYWLIDKVVQDVVMTMEYRYAPQWRFKFENKHAEFKDTYKKNLVDRSLYKVLGTTYHFDRFNFKIAIDSVTQHSEELDKVLKELLAIESIFPANIVNSSDKAYLDYKKLKTDLEEEIEFQANYLAVLGFFRDETETRGNPAGFLDKVKDFIGYFSLKDKFPENVVNESKTVLNTRLDEIVPFFDQRLSGKQDALPFDEKTYRLDGFNQVGTLYETAGITAPKKFTNLAAFVNGFDKSSKALFERKEIINKVKEIIKKKKEMPSDNFFREAVTRTSKVMGAIPSGIDAQYGMYASYNCSKILNEEIAQFTAETEKLLGQYKEAEVLVPRVNIFKAQNDFHGMLGILTQNMHLEFLIDKYRKLDSMSVAQQAAVCRDALVNYRWWEAESGLQKLYGDNTFLDPGKIFPRKEMAVRDLEDSLYIMVDRVSRYRVNKFLEEKIDTLEDIDSLYTDSVFLPAHDIKFSTGSKRELIQRKEDLVAHLAKMKENEFPMKAVKILYEKFIKNPNAKGVKMARAIVAHGEHYKGEDKKTKRRIAECNPWSSKWIVKPKQYRSVFAIPITDNKRGENTYVIRFNIRIPTEAKFPVYDLNIKLPKDVAKNAATAQWYESMTLNKKPLKNEGRFTISAPIAANNYECQVTPVRMEKDKNNFLDIRFKHGSYKVFTLSVMAQKPIIKKH